MTTSATPLPDLAEPHSVITPPAVTESTRPNGMLLVTFSGGDVFDALRAAEAWCAARGISVGRTDGRNPSGLLYGDFDIQKWHNLRAKERAALDGLLTGDKRHGPVTVSIRPCSSFPPGVVPVPAPILDHPEVKHQ